MFTRRWGWALVALAGFSGVARADLLFDQTHVQLGKVRGGPAYSHRVGFRVTGNAPVEILEVHRGCQCVSATFPKTSWQPGESGFLAIQLRTLGNPEGTRTWRVRVRYRQGQESREAEVLVTATQENEVSLTPPELAFHVTSKLRQAIVLTDRRAKPLRVIEVKTDSPALQATVEATEPGKTRIALEADAAGLKTQREEVVLAVFTDDADYSPLQVTVAIQKTERPAISATPNRVVVRDGPGLQTVLVRLRPVGEGKVVVSQATCNDAAVRCSWATGADQSATLKVQIDTHKLSAQPTPIRVECTEPPGAVIELPILRDTDF